MNKTELISKEEVLQIAWESVPDPWFHIFEQRIEGLASNENEVDIVD